MWLSKTSVKRKASDAAAAVGSVTIGGSLTAVQQEAEYRSLKTFAPGGLVWSPAPGQSVLVIKTPSGSVLAGAEVGTNSLQPGEVMLTSGEASVKVSSGGVYITGNLFINGTPWEEEDGA